jgi:hypothetical protein
MRTYEKYVRNPSAMNTYKNKGLKVDWNEHLQKNRGVGGRYVSLCSAALQGGMFELYRSRHVPGT